MNRARAWLLLSLGAVGMGIGGMASQLATRELQMRNRVSELEAAVATQQALAAQLEARLTHAETGKDAARGPMPRFNAALLAIGTNPPAAVFVDGEDMDVFTPVPVSRALELKPGVHRITFLTEDGARYPYEVTLPEGPSRLIIPKLGQAPREGQAVALHPTGLNR